MNDTQRILEIIRVKNLNNIQFCSITGIAPASLSHITSNRSKPTLTILRNVINGFPDVNPEWILMGTGPMFRQGETTNNDDDNILDNDNKKDKEQMKSLFPEDDIDKKRAQNSQIKQRNVEHNWGKNTPSLDMPNGNFEDIVRKTLMVVQKPQPKIVEVRIFFDDGTYQSFGGMAKQ